MWFIFMFIIMRAPLTQSNKHECVWMCDEYKFDEKKKQIENVSNGTIVVDK